MKKITGISAVLFFVMLAVNMYSQDSYTFKNSSPVLQYVVPVQEIQQGESFEIKIAEDTFTDIDQGDKITGYSASLYNGEELPSWISFNEDKLVFTGDTENVIPGEYFIALEAHDMFNAKSVTEIYLRVD